MERLDCFSCILPFIKNNEIREFCEYMLNNCDDYFFVKPASSTGKYHPDYSLNEGGLLRHSIAVALITHEIIDSECYNLTDDEKDLTICSAIVHDIKKYGNKVTGYTYKNHPKLASDFIVECGKKKNIKEEWINFICKVVERHMGKYGTDMPETDAEKILYIADYIVSRKYVEVDFKKITDEKSILTEWKELPCEDIGDYVINFGIHKGEKLKNLDLNYIHFLAEKFQYKDHPIVSRAKQYLKQISKN